MTTHERPDEAAVEPGSRTDDIDAQIAIARTVADNLSAAGYGTSAEHPHPPAVVCTPIGFVQGWEAYCTGCRAFMLYTVAEPAPDLRCSNCQTETRPARTGGQCAEPVTAPPEGGSRCR